MHAGVILAALLAFAGASQCAAQPAAGYWDRFEFEDGAFPDEWHWTGYSEEGGEFLVYDGAFTHVQGGPSYYLRYSGCAKRQRNLPGTYYFLVKDSMWAFAWRICGSGATAGRCLWLSHDNLSGSWGYTFAECSWENLDPGEYPDGYYMWHNATALRSVHHPTAGPLVGWRTIWIDEKGPQGLQVDIYEEAQLIFEESYEYIPDGNQGFGSLGAGEMTPAIDDLWAQWPDPVEASTWGRVKALYR
jgi:hypothetical protein